MCRTAACWRCMVGPSRSSLWGSPIPQPDTYAWHGEADRVGGGVGWRFAGWWRDAVRRWICPLHGRQHRALFGGARSSLLTVVRAVSALHGVRCTWHGGRCLLHRLLRTVHARLMLHGVQTMLHLGLHVACCGLYATCLGGQWDTSCCTGMLHVACLRVACCTLDAAQCKFRSLRGGGCDRIAAVGIGRGACCTLYAACCVLHAARCMLHTQHQASDNVGCALHAVHSMERAACMMPFAASPPTL